LIDQSAPPVEVGKKLTSAVYRPSERNFLSTASILKFSEISDHPNLISFEEKSFSQQRIRALSKNRPWPNLTGFPKKMAVFSILIAQKKNHQFYF